MATENKLDLDKLRTMVHQGVPLENPAEKTVQVEEEVTLPEVETKITEQAVEPAGETETTGLAVKSSEPPARPPDKRRRKPQADYQSLFFTRIDFTHRKPLYITATTHRRLMRIVHLMDESKATISSYVENIILNHLDTFKEEIDTIYRTNNINPTE